MNLFMLVALATVLPACKGTEYIPGLVIRQTNSSAAGGFATRSDACLTNQVDCGGGVSQEICCPSGTLCNNTGDEVCCPTDADCSPQFFAAPQCADPSWFLCTDYQPNIPTYVPNAPEYWCCPTSTQCLVTTEGGFVCSSVNNGDIPGSTVLSGQAPTQASTATTLPTLAGPATAGHGTSSTKTSSPTASSVKNSSATKASSLGIFVMQALSAFIYVIILQFA